MDKNMDVSVTKEDISVALSGSGFRFMCHIGVLRALLDNNYNITEIAGVSGGSIVAALYAMGVTPLQMMELAHKAPFQTFIKLDLASILLNNSLNTGDNLLDWLKTSIGATTTFKDIKMPLHIIATDLNAEA